MGRYQRRLCPELLAMPLSAAATIALTLLAGCGDPGSDFDTAMYNRSWQQQHYEISQRIAAADPVKTATVLTGNITLKQAIAHASANDAELAAIDSQWKAAKLDAISEQAPPDPELRLRLDDFGGSGDLSGTSNTSESLRVSQVFELGGKARARRSVAEIDADIIDARRIVRQLDVTWLTSQQFYRTLAAQQRVEIYERHIKQLSDQIARMQKISGMAGASESVIERSLLVLETFKAKSDVAAGQLTAARNSLAASWGDFNVGFESISGDLNNINPPTPLTALTKRMVATPDVYELQAMRSRNMAERELARRQMIPDLELFGGMQIDSDDDHSFFAAVELDLPLWRWSGREVRAAEHRAAAANHLLQAAINENSRELAEAHGELTANFHLALASITQLIPTAQKSLNAAIEANKQGAEDPWEIVRSMRELCEMEIDAVNALLAYHQARLLTERLSFTNEAENKSAQ